MVPERQPPPHRGAAPAGPRPAPAHWLRAPGAASGRSRRRPPSVLCLPLAHQALPSSPPPPAFVCPPPRFRSPRSPASRNRPPLPLVGKGQRRGLNRKPRAGMSSASVTTRGSPGADLQKWVWAFRCLGLPVGHCKGRVPLAPPPPCAPGTRYPELFHCGDSGGRTPGSHGVLQRKMEAARGPSIPRCQVKVASLVGLCHHVRGVTDLPPPELAQLRGFRKHPPPTPQAGYSKRFLRPDFVVLVTPGLCHSPGQTLSSKYPVPCSKHTSLHGRERTSLENKVHQELRLPLSPQDCGAAGHPRGGQPCTGGPLGCSFGGNRPLLEALPEAGPDAVSRSTQPSATHSHTRDRNRTGGSSAGPRVSVYRTAQRLPPGSRTGRQQAAPPSPPALPPRAVSLAAHAPTLCFTLSVLGSSSRPCFACNKAQPLTS